MRIRPVPPARPGPCTDDGLTATSGTPATPRGGERRDLALVLGALVDRQVGAAVRRGLAPHGALGLPERRGRGGEHDPPDTPARAAARTAASAPRTLTWMSAAGSVGHIVLTPATW